jgi:TetR/AcrR family transcriptional regulator, repressor of fatR-cypB operon
MPKATAILDSALDLFESRGFGATPVPLLAEQAGVATGTIYRYFPGKMGVVNALYRRWKTALSDALLDGLDSDAAPAVAFEGIWRRLCRFVIDNQAGFAFLENHHHQPYLDAESRGVAHDLDTAMWALVADWQQAGAVRAGDPALLVAQVFGGLVGVVRSLRERHLPVHDDLADQTLEGAWNLLAITRRTP